MDVVVAAWVDHILGVLLAPVFIHVRYLKIRLANAWSLVCLRVMLFRTTSWMSMSVDVAEWREPRSIAGRVSLGFSRGVDVEQVLTSLCILH